MSEKFYSLDIDKIRLDLNAWPGSWDIRYVPVVDSTNTFLRDLPDARNRTAVLTDYQSAGRGRSTRTWFAPPCAGLLLSVLITPPIRIPVSYLTMVAGMGVVDAVADVTGISSRLKWPNDVIYHGQKLCGILSEMEWVHMERRVIVGIGVNVNFDPAQVGFPESATSLRNEIGQEVSREDLAGALFKRLDMWYGVVTQDPSAIFEAWTACLDTIGRPVLIVDSSGTWQGFAAGVRSDGGLIVRRDDGQVGTVYAGEVSIRNPGGFTSP